MDKLLLHPNTEEQIVNFTKQPSHTIALVGMAGSGKGAVAARIASELLNVPIGKLGSHPYFRTYNPTKGTISIETAREITSLIKLKTTGNAQIRRVVIIENAQCLTIEAQNALLKTFEEPPMDTVFILTLTGISAVLPTILSRLQVVTLQPIEQRTVIDYFTETGYEVHKVEQFYFMSGGLPGLMHALLTDNDTHPLAQSIQSAKAMLQADSFERLLLIDDTVKQKQTEAVIDALCTISRSALHIEASRTGSHDAALKRWSDVLHAAEEAKQLINKNAQAKLVLTNLFLHI
jgi:DNA polymerase III delta prime subunit